MPRKTKKQKLKAWERRQSLKDTEGTPTGPVKREFSFSLPNFQLSEIKAEKPEKHETSIGFSDAVLFRQDLVKSVVLAVVVFSLEAVVYLAWLK